MWHGMKRYSSLLVDHGDSCVRGTCNCDLEENQGLEIGLRG